MKFNELNDVGAFRLEQTLASAHKTFTTVLSRLPVYSLLLSTIFNKNCVSWGADPALVDMNRGRLQNADLQFEDLFLNDNDDDGSMEEPPSPETTTAECFPAEDSEKGGGVSALTMTLNQMHMADETANVTTAEELRRDVELKWAAIHTHHDIPAQMGSSAPVWIPRKSLTWTAQQYDRLQRINENGDGVMQRATTFVPPHLTVEQPVIQFSLNSGLQEKRAKLRAREKILHMTGVTEAHDQTMVNTVGFRISNGKSGLSQHDFDDSSTAVFSRPPAA